MSCPKHLKYKAIRKPRVDCPECWDMYDRTVQDEYEALPENIELLDDEGLEVELSLEYG